MQKTYKISIALLISACCFTMVSYAQQKVSDRSVSSEFQKLEQKRQARIQMLRQTQQDVQTNTNVNSTQPVQVQPQNNKQQQQLIKKASSQPMQLPTRPTKQVGKTG